MNASVQSKVFIVDDDEGVRDGLKAMLESEDQNVEVYANGRDFLDSYDPSHGGCLLLDLNMPVMSGQQVLDALARKGAALPVIIITSVDDPKVKAQIEFRLTQLRDRAYSEAFRSANQEFELRRREDFPYMPSTLYFFVADPIETTVGLEDAS